MFFVILAIFCEKSGYAFHTYSAFREERSTAAAERE
jgi:hypothetical protein